MSLNGMTADANSASEITRCSSILQTHFSRLLMIVWDWISSTLSLAPDNYSLSFPEGRPVGVMTISSYYFSSHLFSLLFFITLPLPSSLPFYGIFFLNSTLPLCKETSRVYAQCLPSLPSLLLTHGHTEESLWQGTEFLDNGWLLQVMPAIFPEH